MTIDGAGDVSERSAPAGSGALRLDVLKALSDNTRYAIYLELARAALPLATADIAETLDLHPNTVRPHLERMREVGLLQVHVDARGVVGRPQHRYSLSPAAPSLGLEPPSFPILARMLARAAMLAGVDAVDAAEAGREQGEVDGASAAAGGRPCLDALVDQLDRLGFDPAVVTTDDSSDISSDVTIGFMHCPFRDLAEANPDLVCSLHQGLVEGFVDTVGGGRVTKFRSLVARDPCQVDLVVEQV